MEAEKHVYCPFLGMDYDRDTHCSYVEELHRCYKTAKPAPIDLRIQGQYCLGNEYEQCPRWRSTYIAPAHRPSTRLIWPGLISVAAILVVLLLGRAFFSQGSTASTDTQNSIGNTVPAQAQSDTLTDPTATVAIVIIADSPTPEPTPPTATPTAVTVITPTATSTPVASTATSTPLPSATPTKARNVYTVVRGDTLFAIALRHNVTVDALRKANNLKSDELDVGQTIIIP